MMKARLIPLYFPGRDAEFTTQVERLRNLLADDAEILPPAALGERLPEADAVVFPQLLGDAYSLVHAFQALSLPILIVTSEFGTVSMWDWEIAAFLRAHGVETISAPNIELTRKICKGLAVKRELRQTKFLVFQDNPGEGFQASIFKRFYWWEDECTQRIADKFGVSIVKKSFRELGAAAKQIADSAADQVWKDRQLPTEGVSPRALRSALKMYLALKAELDADKSIRAVGINCLNESHFSDTTPCLAWNLLFEEQGIIWGCEADTLSMLTTYILQKSLNAPIMMTNLYPFLMGQAALKHERIPEFPAVPSHPEDHLLLAHCGYLGVVPKRFCTDWTLRSKVLAIVDENATAIDGRLPAGSMTLAKLHPSLDRMMVVEGSLEGYAQYPGSDCRNGAIVKVADGHQLMRALYSHHYSLMTGHNHPEIDLIAPIFNLAVERI